MTTAREQIRRETLKATRERHQRKFRLLWTALFPDIPLAEEATFTNRRWRFDFSHSLAKVAVEIHGGLWLPKGGHTTGTGVSRDARKSFEAAMLGWVVLPITPEDITCETLSRIRDFVRNRALQHADPYKEAK